VSGAFTRARERAREHRSNALIRRRELRRGTHYASVSPSLFGRTFHFTGGDMKRWNPKDVRSPLRVIRRWWCAAAAAAAMLALSGVAAAAQTYIVM
jgi:hypothetical protein